MKVPDILSIFKRLYLIIGIVITTAVSQGFAAGAMPEALNSLKSTEEVSVTNTLDAIYFTPIHKSPETGIIFYPGGYVDPEAYAPLFHSLAESGVLTVILKVPLNLAFFAVDKPDMVLKISSAFN